MPTMLDRLKEMNDFLKTMLFMEDDSLHAALDEGFHETPPVWKDRLSRQLWANSLLSSIKSTSELLDERLTPPGTVKTVQASITIGPITTRPLTAEEKEARRRAREASQPDENMTDEG